MSQIRLAAEKNPDLIAAVLDSISPVKKIACPLLGDILELHGEKFRVFPAATEQEMKDVWSALVDDTLKYGEQYRKASYRTTRIRIHESLLPVTTLFFLYCGQPSCELCKPVRMPSDLFDQLHHLPDPQPSQDGHYQSFSDVFGKPSNGPSLQTKQFLSQLVCNMSLF